MHRVKYGVTGHFTTFPSVLRSLCYSTHKFENEMGNTHIYSRDMSNLIATHTLNIAQNKIIHHMEYVDT